jgi:serine/threonine protein kinase
MLYKKTMTNPQTTSRYSPESTENRASTDTGHAGRRNNLREWKPGKILLNDYTIRKKLGEGGMGIVYLAEKKISSERLQFAVKTVHPEWLFRSNSRQFLIKEIRTWMAIPPHPHIVTCLFFRSIENHMAIFSEYISGGSLAEWIDNRKIRTLDIVLDIAIQAACALQAAHNRHIVHQDVKPANILMTKDGTARLTDFGLAGMCNSLRVQTDKTIPLNSVVSSAGCTPAYCSPEQAQSKKVTHHTDIWSWAVTTIHMITGKICWESGVSVDAYLKDVKAGRRKNPGVPIPASLLNLLAGCLQPDLKKRWKTMAEITEKLLDIYFETTGHPYHRNLPTETGTLEQDTQPYTRCTSIGLTWLDPVLRLQHACNLSGSPHKPDKQQDTDSAGTRKQKLLADLDILEETICLLRNLLTTGNDEAFLHLMAAVADKAALLFELNDIPGSLHHLDQIIECLDRDTTLQSHVRRVNLLELYKRKADVLLTANLFEESAEIYERIHSAFNEPVKPPDTRQMRALRIRSICNYATVQHYLNRYDNVLALYSEALKEMKKPEYRSQTALADYEIGIVHLNRGLTYWQIHRLKQALREYENAAELLISKDIIRSIPESVSDYTKILSNRALVLQALGQLKEAESNFLEAVERCNTQVHDGAGIPGVLGVFYNNLVKLYIDRKEFRTALQHLETAGTILHRYVNLEGNHEFEHEISRTRLYEALCNAGLGRFEQAEHLASHAIAHLEKLSYRSHRKDLREHLANYYILISDMYENAGRLQKALSCVRHAMRIYQNVRTESRAGILDTELLICRCTKTRLMYKSGRLTGDTELKKLIFLLEKTFRATSWMELKRQIDLSRQTVKT